MLNFGVYGRLLQFSHFAFWKDGHTMSVYRVGAAVDNKVEMVSMSLPKIKHGKVPKRLSPVNVFEQMPTCIPR